MSASFARFFVLPQERILKEERIVGAWALEHILASFLVASVLWGGLFVATRVFAPELLASVGTVAVGLFVVHLSISALYVWRRVATTEYIVTAEAVYARRGRMILTVASALLDRVTDLHVHTSLVGRIFGYSGLSVRTAGGGLWMPGLHNPYVVRGTIQQARHELVAQLLRESGRERPTAPARGGPQLTAIQCPNCDLLFDVPPKPRPLDVQCPRCKETGAIFQEAAA